MKRIITIVGPTAVGKSEVGVKVAKAINGEIISADSRQVFKGLDFGSGKITKEETNGVPHHLLDVVEPETYFSVGDFIELADRKIDEILLRKKIPIIVGGSGFYIYALLYDNIANIPANQDLRLHLEKKSTEELFSLLKQKDLEYSLIVDKNNRKRLIRSIEIIDSLGKMPKPSKEKRFDSINIGITSNREDLDKLIEERLYKRWSSIVKEIKNLVKNKVSYNWLDQLGLEYRYVSRFLLGELTEKEAQTKLLSAIKKFSKKQNNWWNRIENVKWFGKDQIEDILKQVH